MKGHDKNRWNLACVLIVRLKDRDCDFSIIYNDLLEESLPNGPVPAALARPMGIDLVDDGQKAVQKRRNRSKDWKRRKDGNKKERGNKNNKNGSSLAEMRSQARGERRKEASRTGRRWLDVTNFAEGGEGKKRERECWELGRRLEKWPPVNLEKLNHVTESECVES